MRSLSSTAAATRSTRSPTSATSTGTPSRRGSLVDVLADETFDVVVASYGRLRVIAEHAGRSGRALPLDRRRARLQGVLRPRCPRCRPACRCPPRRTPCWPPRTTTARATASAAPSRSLFEHHPTATHFRYPYVYGPRQLAPREWCIVRRILDGRPFLILPDDGLSLVTFGYVDNLAHALLLAVDQPEASMGEIFNCGDDERLTIRQVAEIITDELDHDWELIGMPAGAGDAGPPADDELPHDPPGDGHLAKLRDRARLPRRRPRPRGRAPHRSLAGRLTRPSRGRLRGDRARRTRSTTPPRTASSPGGRLAIADPPDLGYDHRAGLRPRLRRPRRHESPLRRPHLNRLGRPTASRTERRQTAGHGPRPSLPLRRRAPRSPSPA